MSRDRLITPSYCFILAANFLLFFGFYLLILFIAPFIVMLFFSGSIIYTDAFKSIGLGVAYFDTLSSLLAWLIFYVIATLTFSAM